MCGRFTLSVEDRGDVATALGIPVEQVPDSWVARYNIAPMQRHFVVRQDREDRELVAARWGLVNHWAKDNKHAGRQINARAETVAERPAYRQAFKARRCVIPADGFYEWSGPKGSRQPHWFHPRDGGVLLFAGLYESWEREPDERETTFTIITTEANALMEPIHDRMPVILADDAADEWLFEETGADRLRTLLRPSLDDLLTVRDASPLVNSVKNEGPALLAAG